MPFVLIVDDSPDIARAVSVMLRSAGYESHAISNGPDAIAFLRTRAVDFMVLDLQMPGMDGFDVLRVLNTPIDLPGVPDLSPPPIAIFTSHHGYHDTAIKLGAVSYISKSKPRELLQLIQNRIPSNRDGNAAGPVA